MSGSAGGNAPVFAIDVEKKQGRFSILVRSHLTSRVTGIFGPTGAGKTSLLHMIAGLSAPDAGRIVFDGRVIFDFETKVAVPPEERGAGIVFQDNRLFPHLSVRENLLFGAHQTAGPADRSPNSNMDDVTFADVVAALELQELLESMPEHLSGGEQKRVALGRALLRHPHLLLLDEPFAALDEDRRRRTLEFLQKYLQARKLPTLLISHDARDILELATEIMVLEEGRVKFQGACKQYFAERDA